MRLSQPFQNTLMHSIRHSSKKDKKIQNISPESLLLPSPIQFGSPDITPQPQSRPLNNISNFILPSNATQPFYPSIVPSSNCNICVKWKNESRRRFFTQNEDILLTKAAIQYNEKSWNIIAQCVPGRTPRQCRDRWMNYLKPNLKFDPWTTEEDELLISLVNEHGTHWTKMISNFPGRSTNAIKNRWNWLLKDRVHVSTSENKSSKTFLPKFQLNLNHHDPKEEEPQGKREEVAVKQTNDSQDALKKLQNNAEALTKSIPNNNNKSARNHAQINEGDVFALWQDPICLNFDTEEVNW